MKPETMLIFANGNMIVHDEKGEEMPELEKPWMKMILEFIESKGIDPRDIKNIKSPSGKNIIPFKEINGWDWTYGPD